VGVIANGRKPDGSIQQTFHGRSHRPALTEDFSGAVGRRFARPVLLSEAASRRRKGPGVIVALRMRVAMKKQKKEFLSIRPNGQCDRSGNDFLKPREPKTGIQDAKTVGKSRWQKP